MTIPPFLGTLPDRSSQTPIQFSNSCDEYLPWLVTDFAPAVNAVAAGINDSGTFINIVVNNDATVTGDLVVTGSISGAGTGYAMRSRTVVNTAGAGTFTPNAKTRALLIQAQGGGGGGGGADGQTGSDSAVGSPGQGGGYVEKFVTSVPASIPYVVGAGGAGGSGAAGNGVDGGDTTVTATGIAVVATGGQGGNGMVAVVNGVVGGKNALSSSGGDINVPTVVVPRGVVISGRPATYPIGGNTRFGSGGNSGAGPGGVGENGSGFGTGGGGAIAFQAATNYGGGDGRQGLIVFTEFY